MGTTGIVLSYEQCSLVESVVFGSSAMYDDGKNVYNIILYFVDRAASRRNSSQ